MKKTGIMGGTFDPIHLGHLITAENAKDALGLDQVLFVPTGCSYFKKDQAVTPSDLRYEMTRLAVMENPSFEASDMEIKRAGNSYTAETLQQLRRERPKEELYFIVGSDTLVLMSLWKDPQVIFDSCIVLVETRENAVSDEGLRGEIRALKDRFHANIQMIPRRNIEISSTEIRDRVQRGASIRYLVPPAVEDFIYRHGLYVMPGAKGPTLR